jgi:putative DNA primase/helicase
MHGVSDASADVAIVSRWWQMWPTANIGIATGRGSQLVVLDVDFRADGDASLAALIDQHGPLPETACIHTGGGGLHYYFLHPGGAIRNSASKLGAGLDIRGDGGYVVAPPSVHVSGAKYAWALACRPAPLPGWMQQRIERSDAYSRVDTAAALAGVAEGERDETLFRLACKLRRADVPRDVAEDLVLRAAAACTPPFPAIEARQKVASAYDRYEAGPDRRRITATRRGLRSVS